MAVEINLVRTLRGLEPMDDEAREQMKIWKLGTIVTGEYRVQRRVERLRWWWKLCAIVAENSDVWPTREAVSDSLKAELGIFQTYYERNPDTGNWIEKRKPGSIALKNMEEDEFRGFCVQAQNMVCQHFLGCDNADLQSALEAYLNPYRNGRDAA